MAATTRGAALVTGGSRRIGRVLTLAAAEAGYDVAIHVRQVDDDALNLLAQQVEDTVRAAGSPEVPSHDVGLAILGPLRDLDEVAYLRFASVYRSFESADDFEREIELLRAHRTVPTSS